MRFQRAGVFRQKVFLNGGALRYGALFVYFCWEFGEPILSPSVPGKKEAAKFHRPKRENAAAEGSASGRRGMAPPPRGVFRRRSGRNAFARDVRRRLDPLTLST